MESVAVALIALVGVIYTARMSRAAKHNAADAKQAATSAEAHIRTGNGSTAGEYLVRIDKKLDFVMRRTQRIEDHLGLMPIIQGGSDDE
jgi:lysylphosphatidylglycerol synthetase-like protein (DUF2156 family)